MNTAHNADIAIAYETFGTVGGEPLLLISGTGAQMIIWPETSAPHWPTAASRSRDSTTVTRDCRPT